MATPASVQLVAEQVTFGYPGHPVLDRIDVTVAAGTRLGLVGENGAGKTTLLHVLAGALEAQQGTVTRHGTLAVVEQELDVPAGATVGSVVVGPLAGARKASDELAAAIAAFDHDEGDTRPQPLQPRAAPRPRILVVDDNVDGAATLAELLRMMGCDVSVANDGTSAVLAVSELRPDVVLLDIGLPDINGYEVARQVRALPGVRQPRLIALTGWGQEQDKRLAAQAGFDEHWTKPVDPSRLQQLAGV